MKANRHITLIFALLIGFAIASCQKDEDEIPFQQDPIGQDDGNDNGNGNGNGNQGTPDPNAGSEFGSSLVAVYNVSGVNLSLVNKGDAANGFYNDARQKEFWDFFTKLIPADMWPQITRLTLYADDQDGTAAYVAPINENDLSKWEMGWNLAYVWSGDQLVKGETAFTAIHEYAHILTLNAGQVNVSGGACGTFHTGEGCSNNNSYINGLVQNYWLDILDENRNINNDNQFYAFYEKYQDRFVSEYAATNPGEDIAETLAVMVVSDNMPTGSKVADKKIQYLYEYQELVTMRQRIRDNMDFNINLGSIGEARSERAHKKQSHNHL